MIKINQMGYKTNAYKKAIVPVTDNEPTFSVIRTSDNSVAFSGETTSPVYCEASGETVCIADFSPLTEAGEYQVITSSHKSPVFTIGENPYNGLRKAVLGFLNYQKCGVAVNGINGENTWSHPPCHTSLGFVINQNGEKTGETKDVSGGWHDAGDYGRYIVPAAQTVMQLLYAFETGETKDGELLNVTWFEIEWMLKMQDEKTGGVYHKVSCRNFDPLNEMPHEETGELLICPVTQSSTSVFAAAMAFATQFYPEQKQRLLNAAVAAWKWCENNPPMHGDPDKESFVNPPGITTGPYSRVDLIGGYFWAACELFAVTGDEIYHDYIKGAEIRTGVDWKEPGTYGMLAYIKSPKADAITASRMKEAFDKRVQRIAESCNASPYEISVGTCFRWGSSWDIANNAMLLLLADNLNKNNQYRQYAAEHFHYLLGKNALNQSYISGFGSNPFKNPHHRPSVAAGKPVPGMVAGGANGNTNGDPVLHKHCAGFPPMKCYTDHAESFSSNEVTIYWNSPVYYVMTALGI